MAEGRMLKKEIANSKKLAAVSERASFVWFMMLPHTDIKGRVKACPQIVKGQYLTMTRYAETAVQKALEELHAIGLIILYRNNGNQYAEYTRFGDFQKLYANKEAESRIPAPTLEDSGVTLEDSPLSKVKISKEKITLKPNPADIDNFKIFWKEYPRKVGRELAREKWLRIDFSTMDSEKIINQVKLLKKTEWMGKDDKYIPHASTWLSQKRYYDEIESGKKLALPEKKICVACEKPATMKVDKTWYCGLCYGKSL